MVWWRMKPIVRWWNKSLPTLAPNRKTLLHLIMANRLHAVRVYRSGPYRADYLWLCVCILCRDSCQRGWRLMYILTAFHRCSDVMKPFLLKFLQDACASTGVQYQGKWSIYFHLSILHNYSFDWLLLLTDRYCKGMWAESEEDFSIWRACTVSEQHGTESYAGESAPLTFCSGQVYHRKTSNFGFFSLMFISFTKSLRDMWTAADDAIQIHLHHHLTKLCRSIWSYNKYFLYVVNGKVIQILLDRSS